ncbi:MAG: DUF1385 domain-containing protein [Actinobacteria bacterium]|nr:DUF1385 domain-containing protein [Actinomycetota bacterium]MBV8961448.1 DUF1385 domain-containing protein [Actinomycetota bacterium]MBV9662834.1 DUF1385 domain-containing protein [Actinomycetota bacterium]MBV9936480.1 DUF1385 domain-containing protein [Actinomycetota bacterium]
MGSTVGKDTIDKPIKAGGQALADGVLMRTERAWAIARADGTVEVGEVPPVPMSKVPVLRVVMGLGAALKLGVVRGVLRKGDPDRPDVKRSRRVNMRFLQAALLGEVAVMVLSRWMSHGAPDWVNRVAGVLPWLIVLLVLRIATPSALWRFHGAEHKAVTAHEQGVDLSDTDAVLGCSRIHNRCGTNLVFLMGVLSYFVTRVPAVVEAPMFLVMLGVSVETLSLASRRPRFLLSRLLLAGGKLVQRFVTTREPTAEEQAIGCRALRAALAEHERLAADERVLVAA